MTEKQVDGQTAILMCDIIFLSHAWPTLGADSQSRGEGTESERVNRVVAVNQCRFWHEKKDEMPMGPCGRSSVFTVYA